MAKTFPSRWPIWIAAALPILIVAGIVLGYAWSEGWTAGSWFGGQEGPTAANRLSADLNSQQTVSLGQDVYIFAKVIELYPERPPGDRQWDSVDDSAPDIQYALRWQGTIQHESSIRKNALLATWDGITVDLKNALLNGEIEPSQALNHAATINITEDGELSIHVWDEDAIGLGRDDAGQIDIALKDLLLGDNIIERPASKHNGIKRVVLRVTATDQPIDNLLEALTAP
jgi:hypothetical protein